MDHWTLGSQVTMYHYNATSSRLDPAPHAFGMRRRGADSETQTHGATPDETATPDRRPKPSTADWRREAGSSAGTPQQLPTCIGAPKTMETNTGHSGMELPERSTPFSFDTWLLPTEVTMRFRNCSRNHHRPVPIATLHSHKKAHTCQGHWNGRGPLLPPAPPINLNERTTRNLTKNPPTSLFRPLEQHIGSRSLLTTSICALSALATRLLSYPLMPSPGVRQPITWEPGFVGEAGGQLAPTSERRDP